jgi:exosome complex component RRP4
MTEESKLLIKEKEIVVPGEELAKGMDFLPSAGSYRSEDAIVSEVLGIAKVDGKVIKVVPLTGKYMPKRNDVIIVQVSDVTYSSWSLDTFSPYSAMMSMKDATAEYLERGADLTKIYNIGDYIVAKVTNVTSQKLVDITVKGPGLRKLRKGRIIHVNSNKVPRIIGKQGSMVNIIKEHTGAQVAVGQNGVVWIYSENPEMENLSEKAIRKIEDEAHTSGLTEKMQVWLAEQVGGKK